MSQQNSIKTKLPFGLTRFLSWISLVLILISSIILALFIGNSARHTLLLRQQQYALLIVGNLNHQIYRRFTLPTFLTFGRIALRRPVQYKQLDEVILSTIHGLHINSLRIYGMDKIVTYSINKDELGQEGLIPPTAETAIETISPSFEILSTLSLLSAMFTLNLPSNSFILRTIFPLTIPFTVNEEPQPAESIVTGLLEITQDITDDYGYIIRFQWLILATCLSSSIILFILLQFFIVKAERILSERMTKNHRLEMELHQNEKLASMGRVIASIAHEIRNPLGIIRSSAELLLRRAIDINPDNKQILTAIYDESCRLSQTVNDFLDYARPKILKQELLNLNSVLEQVLGFLQGEATKRHITISKEISSELQLYGDTSLLYRALYNILINAFQSINKDGFIHINGKKNKDSFIELTFQDSGPGFPQDQIQHVTSPFYTTKDNGTGLGLPIANSIIQSHHGQLILKNSSNGGALIQVLLPTSKQS